MSRPITSLVVASHNQGKAREIHQLLAPLGIDVKSAAELDLPEPEETGDTFEANAELKSRAATETCGLVALADDSGLAIPELDGAPGIYSARWAGPNKDFAAAMDRIHAELKAKGVEMNGCPAYFVCVLSLARPDGTVQNFRGEVHGLLTYPARGEHGFGYDPIFIPEGYKQTFGEMNPEQKERMSHRTRAFAQLVEVLSPGQTKEDHGR